LIPPQKKVNLNNREATGYEKKTIDCFITHGVGFWNWIGNVLAEFLPENTG
jgi:hypothetical protein